MVVEYKKPLPLADSDSKEFWEGCKRHELLVQRCEKCHAYRFPPGLVCVKCLSTDAKWEKVSGKGEVYTFIIVRTAASPAWEEDVPYVTAIVQLKEGVRMTTNIIGCKPEDVKIGMKVEVVFDDVTKEDTLPKFKPVS